MLSAVLDASYSAALWYVTYPQLNSGVALIVTALPQCRFHTHISNSIVDNCDTFRHFLNVCSMLKSLDAVEDGLHCYNLSSQLSCQQCVVANVCTNVKHLPINIGLLTQ